MLFQIRVTNLKEFLLQIFKKVSQNMDTQMLHFSDIQVIKVKKIGDFYYPSYSKLV